jgi:hypothetical protein
LPDADTEVVNPDTGIMTVEWYDFFFDRDRARSAVVSYSPSMTVNAGHASDFTITATNGTAFTIEAPRNPTSGQVITFTIKNASGGALGTITWDAVFKMPAFTSPANGFNRSVTFAFDGTNWLQRYQSAADVPN